LPERRHGGVSRVNNLLQLVNRLGLARVAAMAVVAVLLLGFFGFLVLRASSPSMAPLYSGLSIEDSAAIVSDLQRQNVPYELRGEGDTILVPRDQITAIRMSLAQEGLPQRGQVGYEIFDQQNTLGATSFVQNLNNVRALEGELARTITSLARIKSARVHLVLPERELFQRERKDPTASIVLAVRGELSSGEIRAIQHLVASAVEGLTPNRVSIVDDTGTLLASGAGEGEDSIMAAETEERTLAIENRLRTRIEDLLANIVGAGKARVQVSAELDLERITRTAETFDPDGQVVRSTQTRQVDNQASGGAPEGGPVTVANELPGSTTTANGGTSERGSTTEETLNYEISKTAETVVGEAGGIKRLSVAVVVDGIYTTDANGNATYQPRSDAELQQLIALVKTAAGINETRGDQVQVVNLQFAERPDLAAAGTDGPGLFDFTRDDLIGMAQMGVTLLIALALIFFVMRPLLKRVLAPEQQSSLLALPRSAEVAVVAEPVADMAMSEPHVATPKPPAWLDSAKSLGESQMQTLKTVGTLVEENPKQAALIVRDWLSGNAA
jgi:flagellar M-ring protein FliF